MATTMEFLRDSGVEIRPKAQLRRALVLGHSGHEMGTRCRDQREDKKTVQDGRAGHGNRSQIGSAMGQ